MWNRANMMEIRAECGRRGLWVGGIKSELVKLLEEDDAARLSGGGASSSASSSSSGPAFNIQIFVIVFLL